MDIERLTKTQIVLLTLLVSFVTSIATGIVTVSLLDQAPPAITQTINRVVERTVERVVPDKTLGAVAATKEVTVVVKEEDLITSSIDKNAKSLGRIFGVIVNEAGEGENTLLGLGTFLTRDGILATDAAIVFPGGAYTVRTADGGVYDAKVLSVAESSGIALLALQPKKDAEPASFSPAALGTKAALKLGQTVISLSGRERTNVGIGIVSALATEDIPPAEPGGATTTAPFLLDTSLGNPTLPGSPLLNIFGEVIGVSTGWARERSRSAYTPVRFAEAELAKALAGKPAEGR